MSNCVKTVRRWDKHGLLICLYLYRLGWPRRVLRHSRLDELTRDFHSVLSPSCAAEDSRSGEGFQACLDRGSPCLQLVSSSSAPRARWCGQKYVLVQFTVGTPYYVAKPSALSLHLVDNFSWITEYNNRITLDKQFSDMWSLVDWLLTTW